MLPQARLGARSALVTEAPGVLEQVAIADHRVQIHVGAPTRGACRLGTFLLEAGDIVVIPAGASDVCEARDPSTSLIVRLAPQLLQRVAEEMGLYPDRAGLAPRHQLKDPRIKHIAWAIELERCAGGSTGGLYAESLAVALAAHLLGNHAVVRKAERGLSAAVLRKVTDYIEDHLDQDLSLVRLAEIARMSSSHFKTLFRHATGVPVHRYVVQRRVERATHLLQTSALSISQVALEVGFAHASHMARCMRRELGVLPSAVRRGAM